MHTTTRILHENDDREMQLGSVNPPIYHSSLFTFPNMQEFLDAQAGTSSRYIYSRHRNPTVEALEQKIAMLEGGDGCIATASGMGAITAALLATLKSGDHALVVDSCYGPTRAFLDGIMAGLGVTTIYFHPEQRDISGMLRANTRALYLESPGSLSFHILDVPELSRQAREAGVTVIIDNSWATPLYQQPLSLGVDIVVHTGTKYLGGHSDLLMGAIISREDWLPPLRQAAELLGATLGPAEAYLALRSLRTLPLRMAQHQGNGLAVAAWLSDHPKVRRVLHPGLPTFPGHELARQQFSGWSSLFAVELLPPVSPEQRHGFVDALQIFSIGVSWGGYESLLIPLHATTPAVMAQRQRLGLNSDHYRLSIGLEDPADLIDDLSQALARYEIA
ncbi:MAG: PLP-dependent transferase [Caldilineales bacterium]|nr:PLP-dependent transferase [Caldilineales bacterium]